MKHITFKRKAKGIAALGSIATVSSLVLAACADNTTTTPAADTSAITKLLEANKTGFQSLLTNETSHLKTLVDQLSFEKDFNAAVFASSSTVLGTKDSAELSYDSSDDAAKKLEKLSAVSAFSVLNKINKTFKTESEKTNTPPITPADYAKFKTLFDGFSTAAAALSKAFTQLPDAGAQTDNIAKTLTTSSSALKTEIDTFDKSTSPSSSDLKTKTSAFLKLVDQENTSLAPLLKAALGLTKATVELNTFVSSTFSGYLDIAQHIDTKLEFQALIQKVLEQVLGQPGTDLFASQDEVPFAFETNPDSTQVYSAFAKLFRLSELKKEFTESVNRLSFYKHLISYDTDAIAVFATALQKDKNLLTLSVDSARLNAFLSFANSDLVRIFNNVTLFKDKNAPSLNDFLTGFTQLESDFTYLQGTKDDTNSLLHDLSSLENNHMSDYSALKTEIEKHKTEFTSVLELIKKAKTDLTTLKTKISELNSLIVTITDLDGILKLLSKVEEIKTAVKDVNEDLKVTIGEQSTVYTQGQDDAQADGTKNKVEERALSQVYALFDLSKSDSIGSKLKALVNGQTTVEGTVKITTTTPTARPANKKQYKATTSYESGKVKGIVDRLSLTGVAKYFSAKKSLDLISSMLETTYAPSTSSQTFTLFNDLASKFAK